MLPLSEIQSVLYSTLTPALAPVPVVDHAGPDQEYPYATIGEFTVEPLDTLRDAGSGVEVMLHLWSRQRGMLELETMMNAAGAALHRQYFSLPGDLQWVSTVQEYASTLRDADGMTRHGVMRFRVMIFQPAASAAQ